MWQVVVDRVVFVVVVVRGQEPTTTVRVLIRGVHNKGAQR